MKGWKRRLVLVIVLMWWVAFMVHVYHAVGISWRIAKSNHRMYDECQRNPEHRELFYASCLQIERNGKQPTFFWIDVCIEASPSIYPFIWFELGDVFTLKGLTTLACMTIIRKFISEAMEHVVMTTTPWKNKRQ